MKPKTTIILVALLLVVGVSVWISKQAQRSSESENVSPPRRVFPKASETVKKLTIESRDGTKLVFVHSDDQWNMIEPRLLPAKVDVLDDIVRTFRELQYRRVLDPLATAETLSDTVTGLDTPRWTVTLTQGDDTTLTLHVGLPAPKVGGANETYVRPAGDNRTLVVQRDLASVLKREVKAYREMTVLPRLQPGQITALRVEGRETYALRKQASERWNLTKPFTARAKEQKVETLLRTITSDVKAERFLSESPSSLSPFGLDRPQLVLYITARDDVTPSPTTQSKESHQTYTLLLGNRRGKSVCAMVKGQPEVFTLPEAMLDKLQPSLESFRSKALLDFTPDQVHRVTIRKGANIIELQRQGEWTLNQPFSGPADAQAVDALLQSLQGLRAEKWIAPRAGVPVEITSPRAIITLSLHDDTQTTLRIGATSGDQKTVFCQRAGTNSVATVNVESIAPLLKPAREYWSKLLLPLSVDATVQGMTLDRADGTYVLARQNDEWILLAPTTGPVSNAKVQSILETLRTTQAGTIESLGASAPESYSGTQKRVTVSLSAKYDGEVKTYRLVVVKTKDGCVAWRTGQTPVAVGTYPNTVYTQVTESLEKE